IQRDLIAHRLKAPGLRKHVRWLRSVAPERIAGVLAATDALVITSTVEGFPMVMLEALAMGVPVFTYDVGDVSLAIKHGYNGYVFQPGDFAGLADALRRYMADPDLQEALSANARPSLIESGFT